MPVPTSINDLSQTAASNYPQGTDSPATLDDVQRSHASFIALLRDGKGRANRVSLASASTTDIGGQNSLFVEVTGTTTITSLGTSYNGPRYVRFAGALTLTHNASLLNLIGGANITTVAGDFAVFVPNTALNGWDMALYQRWNGLALTTPTMDGRSYQGVFGVNTSLTMSSVDYGKHFVFTGTTAQTFTLPAPLLNKVITVFNNGTAAVNITHPSGLFASGSSGTTVTLQSQDAIEVVSDGSAWYTSGIFYRPASLAETQILVDLNHPVTPATLGYMLFAKGQARYNRTSSRAFGSTYTNNSSKAREVSVLGFTSGISGAGGYIYATIDSTKTAYMGNFFCSGGSYPGVGRAIVQPGETYSVNVALTTGGFTLNSWWEMDV